MKLATLRNDRPDGQLVVVSADLKKYVSAGRIAPSLQSALDDWDETAPQLAALSDSLNAGDIAGQNFDPLLAMAPLPRAYQWIDGAGYLGHLERVRSLKGSKDTELQSNSPLMYQGASDSLSAATDDIVVPDADLATDFEAEIAAIIGPVAMGAEKDDALAQIRLLTLCNDVSLRRLVVDDLQNGFGFFHAKPSTSFAPVVVTPDELSSIWVDGRLNAKVHVDINDQPFGRLQAGEGMFFDFGDLIKTAAKTRNLGAGTIIGSGTIANDHDETLPLGRNGIGFGCIAEARTVEKMKNGKATTGFLQLGDRVRMEALDQANSSLFGAINQTVVMRAV